MIAFVGDAVELIAKAEVQSQVLGDAPVVLEVERVVAEEEVPHAGRAGLLERGQVAVEGGLHGADASEEIVVEVVEALPVRRRDLCA